MKVALERMRPLERKMRYQIDKLLALSTLGAMEGAGSAGTFASVGREIEEEEKADDEEMETIKKSTTGDGGDPLSFKPDLQGMIKMFEEEDGNDGVSSEGERYLGFDSFIIYRHSTNSCHCVLLIECTRMHSHPQMVTPPNNIN